MAIPLKFFSLSECEDPVVIAQYVPCDELVSCTPYFFCIYITTKTQRLEMTFNSLEALQTLQDAINNIINQYSENDKDIQTCISVYPLSH